MQQRTDDAVEMLGLAGIARARATAVAETKVGAADVQKPIVGRTGARGRIEFERAYRVEVVVHDMGDANELAMGSAKSIRRGRLCAPFRNHRLVGNVRPGKAWRNELRNTGITLRLFAVHGVDETVAREVGVERKADESAFETAVEPEREFRCEIKV